MPWMSGWPSGVREGVHPLLDPFVVLAAPLGVWARPGPGVTIASANATRARCANRRACMTDSSFSKGIASLGSCWRVPQTFHVAIEEIERRLVGERRRHHRITQVQRHIVLHLVGRPFGQIPAIGIAGGREV